MINACEMCNNVATLKEEALFNSTMETIKFCDGYLTERFKNLLTKDTDLKNFVIDNLAFKENDSNLKLYTPIELSSWKAGFTHRGYSKRTRECTPICNSINLDYLEKYCAQFGYKLSFKKEFFTTDEFSSYVKDWGFKGIKVIFSISCF